eukprot:2729336-Lingulodinium_polyedra.AAC.1
MRSTASVLRLFLMNPYCIVDVTSPASTASETFAPRAMCFWSAFAKLSGLNSSGRPQLRSSSSTTP